MAQRGPHTPQLRPGQQPTAQMVPCYYVRLLQCLIELLKEHSKYSEAYLVIYLWMEIRCPMACNQEIMHTVYLLSCFSHV